MVLHVPDSIKNKILNYQAEQHKISKGKNMNLHDITIKALSYGMAGIELETRELKEANKKISDLEKQIKEAKNI